MNHGAITSYVDWAQIALYLFWIFFAGLVYYLQRESKREGFPLQHNTPGGRSSTSPGLVGMPTPKTYVSLDGSTHTAPNNHQSSQKLNARPMNRFNGAPLDPVGNPLLAGVGPGAWADRADKPEMTPHGDLVLVPLRAAKEISVSKNDVNPIGLNVLGADDEVAGVVKELWVDQSEMIFRHIEIEVKTGSTTRRVLVPMTFARVHRGLVKVEALLAKQFEQIPGLKNPDQITMLEEEKITAYFGAGTLYATPGRQDPLF